MYYIAEDHEPIIEADTWQAVQLERERRKKYLNNFNLKTYTYRPETIPFSSKIICGGCNKPYSRKGWKDSKGGTRVVWQCSERYKVKGVMGCTNRHIDEKTIEKAYLIGWNEIYENREYYLPIWKEQIEKGNELEAYRAKEFMKYSLEKVDEISSDFILKTLSHIKIMESGNIVICFLEGTEVELETE